MANMNNSTENTTDKVENTREKEIWNLKKEKDKETTKETIKENNLENNKIDGIKVKKIINL